MSGLSIIIPSRTITNLRPCVAAIRKHEHNSRIIVVDDGLPTVMDLDFIKPIDVRPVEVIEGRKPFVFSVNCNLGIRHVGDDDVILCNDDCLLETPGGFSLLQQAARENPHYGIIGAVTNLTGQPLQQPRGIGLREVEHIAFVCVLIPERTRQHIGRFDGIQEGDATVTHDGINVKIRPCFTGGFLDERYTGYGSDDLDYCMQVRHAGLRVGVHDGCYVDHGSLHSSYRGAPTAAGDIWPNHRLLRAKWGMEPNPADPLYRGGGTQ